MNWLDGIIVLAIIGAIVRGIELGFVRQLCSGIGFFGGLFIGIWAEGRLIHLAHTSTSRTALAIGIIFGCAFLLLAIGEFIGDIIKSRISTSRFERYDRALGSGAAAIIATVAVWLGVTVFASFPSNTWQHQVEQSHVVAALNKTLPAGPTVLAKIGRVISPNGFPKVFNGIEPTLSPSAVRQPDMGVLTNAVNKDRLSVVKIEGKGCGGIVEGSGFVADTNTVITNAHVIAGVEKPEIFDTNGKHTTEVIWFNPDLDMAVLRARNLAGAPLTISKANASSGTPAAALGYPEGGDFTASPAAIINSFAASGQNIYNAHAVTREIYSLNAAILPGNSGGPLINTQGTVVGLVFARSAKYNSVGYALTMQQVLNELAQAEHQAKIVGTGNCAE